MVERLRQAANEIPAPFSTRENVRRFFKEGQSPEGLEREKLRLITEVLNNPELGVLIDEGKVTLGIIKPQAHQGRYERELTDEEAAEKILEEICQARVIFKLSLQLTREQAEEFYAPVRESYENLRDNMRPGVTVWESIISYTSSGPLTLVLIYDEGGNAIEWWREKMGDTHPAEAHPESIRGKYGIEENLPNNLVHGSAQISEIKRELGVLREVLGPFLK